MPDIFNQLTGHGAGVIFGMVLGSLIAWLLGIWRRRKQRQRVLTGDARDTIVINHHLVQTARTPDGATVPSGLAHRSLGQSELDRVVPNGHLARVLARRALHVTSRNTLISMEGAEGSYLLETLTNFVCDRVNNAAFDHDLYVMAPCCEPAGLAEHQPVTILLIAIKDLALFESWPACRNIQVEHGTEGLRVLTLMDLSRRFRSEQTSIASLRQAGKRTRYVETMYILDLALDKSAAVIPTKNVPWGRFEDVLKEMNLE